MHVWNLLHAARWKYRTQKWRKKSPSVHHPTTLSGYIFATKACIDNRKKNLLSSNMSSTCLHNMVNFGPLAADICWRVWGIHANFNGFRVLAALLHGIPVLGVSQTLRGWTEGATYIRQGGHHVGHWPTFLVCYKAVFISVLWSSSINLSRSIENWPLEQTQSSHSYSSSSVMIYFVSHLCVFSCYSNRYNYITFGECH